MTHQDRIRELETALTHTKLDLITERLKGVETREELVALKTKHVEMSTDVQAFLSQVEKVCEGVQMKVGR